jgi:hypothetical protein
MSLQCIVPDTLWHATQPLRFGPIALSTRMTVVRLQDGSLWVHSPITPSSDLTRDLAGVGHVRYVIAPNRSHHLFFLPFLEVHPSAAGFVAPGLDAKRPDLRRFPRVPAVAPWSGELQGFFIEGLPVLNETVWFHHASGTLVITDLLFCFSTESTGLTGLVARVLGVRGTLGMSRTMKLLVKDRAALKRSADALLALPVQRIIVAHDEIIDRHAAEKLRKAFAWLAEA